MRDLGICPSATETKLDGIHGGINAGDLLGCGRHLLQRTGAGTFGQKYKSCEICDFYRTVKQEEHLEFKLSAVILDKLRSM